MRTADVPCRVGGDEFAVIMPESSLDDAEQLFQRIQTVMSTRALGQAGRLHLSAGLAEFTPEDDSDHALRASRPRALRRQAGRQGPVHGGDGLTQSPTLNVRCKSAASAGTRPARGTHAGSHEGS